MCGIFGIVVRNNSNINYRSTLKLTNNLFKLSETRGKESSGIAIKNNYTKEIYLYKKSISASSLIKSNKYKEFYYNSLNNTFKSGKVLSGFSLIAHSRLVTNGSQENNDNNQPVVKSDNVIIHNGIIVNIQNLWDKYNFLNREFEVDTEIIPALFTHYIEENKSIEKSTNEIFDKIYGTASTAMLSARMDNIILTTNNGSLYYTLSKNNDIFIYASEKYILLSLLKNNGFDKLFNADSIKRIEPYNGLILNETKFEISDFSILNKNGINTKNDIIIDINYYKDKYLIKNLSDKDNVLRKPDISEDKLLKFASLLEYNINEIKQLKRCSSCLLPETFPFIEFDDKGVCNYCNNYKKIKFEGLKKLQKFVEPFKIPDNKPDCLVTFSGGRDSSYGLHFIKKELGLNPIAYTYDWGMVTDLARRNQARLCGKMGIEHIIVSADIKKKRDNIRKNVSAWLKKPHLGTIPLFMAGDKHYFYYANKLSRINNLNLVVLCENMLETTNFKSGFCGIKPNFGSVHTYSLSIKQQLQMMLLYGKEFMTNPSYLNSSLIDTFTSYVSYYFLPHNYLNLYNYIKWDENIIEKTLFDEYDWELSPDTKTSWRIGDGTAAFYNYIYYTITGFSEFDTFRSNQIREGMIDRETALKSVNIENYPRFESIKWYLDTIDLDFERVIKRINSIQKLYNL